MTESTAESIAHPVAFGAAMLVMFINWMVIGRPDGSWWMWAEHIGADLAVLWLMAGVAVATSCVKSGWLARASPAAKSVRDRVDEVERGHRAASHGVGFLAAAGAFGLVGDQTERPVLMLGVVLGAFVAAQVAVMLLLRPRAESALRRALEAASAGLTEPERSALSAELGVQ